MSTIDVLEVGRVEGQQDACVDELTNKDADHSVIGLFSDGCQSHTLDQIDKDNSQHKVDADNHHRHAHFYVSNGSFV